MGGFIVLLIFAIIGIFISRANKLAQKEGSGSGSGKSFGENFPFPTLSDNDRQEPFDPWDMSPRTAPSPAAEEICVDEIVVDEVEPTTYRSIDMSKHNTEPTEEVQETTSNKIEFDLRQAVIYSEILKPKYMEQ